MKQFLLFFLGLSTWLAYGQNGSEKINLEFQGATRLELIREIEQRTNYRFFYVEDWFESEQLTGSFENRSVRSVMEELFDDTLVNFYIGEDFRIILTRNSLIHDTLPSGFFDPKTPESMADKAKPVFYQSQPSVKVTGVETLRIGKENRNASRRHYNLSGQVRNNISREPIPNLVISVIGKNINAVTDLDGNYTIDLPVGENKLELKSLGIESLERRVIIYNDGTFNFDLAENPELLDEVILDADKDDNIMKAVTGITQIKVKEIKNIPLVLGERDMLKVATTLPGVSTTGEGAGGYNVRGGQSDQNLMLLDNAVLYNPSHFFGIFSALNPYTTGELDIYKGNIPAEYGGRLSSVFDIRTKDGNTEKFSGEGAIGPVTSNLTLEIPIVKNKSSLLIGGRGTYSDWILKQLDEESLQNSKASFYDFIGKYNHILGEKDQIETTGYYSNDVFSISSDSTINYTNALFSVKWDHRFDEKMSGSLIVVNSNYAYDILYDSNSSSDFKLNYKVQETELKFLMNHLVNEKHRLTYGVSGKLYNNQPTNIKPNGDISLVTPSNIEGERALESGLFISDDYNLSKALSFNLGLRYSYYAFLGPTDQNIYVPGLPKNEDSLLSTENYGNNEVVQTYGGPEIRVSGRYSFSPSFSVKGSYNNNYQFIHSLTTNTTASPTDTWKLSDLNIKPQRANQFSLGLFKNLDGNTYELSLEGYYKLSDNILDYKVGADLMLNENIESEVLQGEGKAYGLEFLLRKNIGKLNGWIGYTYARSFIKLDSEFEQEKINEGKFFPSNYDKPHDFSMVANYKLTKRYSFSMNFIYQTGRPVTIPVGNYTYKDADYVFYSNRNEFRIPDYIRLDLGINIEGNHKIKKLAHSFWNISVYNVLGRNNPYSVFFVTENGQIKAYQSSIFSVPVPTITYNFRF